LVFQANGTCFVADPVSELQLLRKSTFELSPGSFSWMQVYVEEAMHLRFNCSLSTNAQVAVYGRKGLRPSHTKVMLK